MAVKALTVAGSDSGGGAGIQADLKTFSALGVYGVTVITAITAQNTVEVRSVYPLPVDVVLDQLEAVVSDIGFDAAKTGMIYDVEQVEAVSKFFRENPKPLVVDPVFQAEVGADLTSSEAYTALREKLIPLATVVTPNLDEASILAGFKVKCLKDAVEAAEAIAELGCEAVVVKGGHMKGGKAVDVLYWRGKTEFLEAEKVEGGVHGSGCSFSAAITAGLAKGRSIGEAVREAKEFVTEAIRFGVSVGSGVSPVNPLVSLYREADRYRVIRMLNEAVKRIEKMEGLERFIPEVRSNLVMAVSYPRGLEDVAGFPSRIAPYRGRVKAFSKPEFGASKHVARAVLELIRLDGNLKAGMNIRYSEEMVEACRSLGFRIGFYDRREEPPEVKRREGATIPWGIRRAWENAGRKTLDIIYHLGDWGKEPMILVLGKDALDVVDKLEALLKTVNRGGQVSKASDTPGPLHSSP